MLLVALMALGLSYPLLGAGVAGCVFWLVLFWTVLLGVLHAISLPGVTRRAARFLAATAFIAGVAILLTPPAGSQVEGVPVLQAVLVGSHAAFLAFTSGVILRDVFRGRVVTGDKILGAICAYLLIGLTFAFTFALLDLCGGRFTFDWIEPPQGLGIARLEPMLYFSFVTLTTLGYGDVVPMDAVTRLFASAEGVIGQLYLTILVARLVGLHITQPRH